MSKGQRQTTLMDYDGFVEKFRSKKTTDDCFTPPEIYKVVKNWACERFGIDPESIVRPFYPDLDYVSYDYPDGCCVLDNPPFSILAEITKFYLDHSIKFFLFAPTLTCFSSRDSVLKTTHIVAGVDIVYENGAKVSTSFITNCDGDIVAMSAPDLCLKIKETTDAIRHNKAKPLPKYEYPDEVLTAARLSYFSKHETPFFVKRSDCCCIDYLDSQKAAGKSIFGGGLLLSTRAAAERAAAERAAAERAAAERAAAERWSLSDREHKIIQMLDEGRTGLHNASKS